jgi:AcrR family transcriptional regulator
MAVARLSRVEQTERNRSLVLDAARRVFMDRGYHAATLEQIAEEAGFSKGVVYSQFESKADLFLALLDKRVDERAAENAELAADLVGADGLRVLLDHFVERSHAAPEWGLLLSEFRVHAARNPEVNRRYAAIHARTVEYLGEVLDGLYSRAAQKPPFPPGQMAEIVLAIGVGSELEQAVNPHALQGPLVADLLGKVLLK